MKQNISIKFFINFSNLKTIRTSTFLFDNTHCYFLNVLSIILTKSKVNVHDNCDLTRSEKFELAKITLYTI